MASIAATRLPPSAQVVVRSLKAHGIYLAVSAVLLALAYPQPGWGVLAFVALVPMTLLSLRSTSMWRVAWTSYVMALIWWIWMIRWMQPVTTGGWIGLAALTAIYTPLALVTVRWLDNRYRWPMVITLPLVWISFEWYRCNHPSGGFGWFTLGSSQAAFLPSHGVSRLLQVADLFGDPGVGFLIAMTNGLIVDLLHRQWVKPTLTGRRMARTMAGATAFWLILIIGALFYGQVRLNQKIEAWVAVRVAVVQTNIPQNNKQNPTPEQEKNDWQQLLEITRRAAMNRPAMIVWPETIVPASLNPEATEYYRSAHNGWRGSEKYHEQLQELARELGISLLVGAGVSKDWKLVHGPDGRDYQMPSFRQNSVFLYGPDGTQNPLYYSKIHLVPFGEYIPWVYEYPWLKKIFFSLFVPETYQFDYTMTPGSNYKPFEIGGLEGIYSERAVNRALGVGTPICFEDSVGYVCRNLVYDKNGEKQSDLLVNLTNDGWFAGTDQPAQEFQLATVRCVENRVPMARSVNTGISGFIDAYGIVNQLVDVNGKNENVEGYKVYTMVMDERKTLFGKVGQWPPILLAMTMVGLAIGGFWRKPRRKPWQIHPVVIENQPASATVKK